MGRQMNQGAPDAAAMETGRPGAGRKAVASRSGPASPPRHASPWRDLFVFRARPSAEVEAWVGIGGFVFMMAAWIVVTELGLVRPQFLPSPLAVWRALVGLFENAGYLQDIGISVARVWIAFVASALVAIPFGILISGYRGIGAFSEPLIDFVRYLPVPALVPLTLIWLGIGESSKIALLFIGTFFQLVLLISDDARRVPKEFIETGRTLGARDRALMTDVLFPAMLPNMVDSLRITLGWCWTYLLVAEIVASSSGIGYELWTARRYGKTPEVFAGILTIGVIGLATDQIIRAMHRRYFRYLT
jgi:NitT/TauT family transport system permease protein